MTDVWDQFPDAGTRKADVWDQFPDAKAVSSKDEKPAPEVVKRGTILPLVDMSDGTAAFGAPEWIAGPARALKSFVESGLQYQPGTGDESIGKTAADAAEAYLGLAVPGSRFASPSREMFDALAPAAQEHMKRLIPGRSHPPASEYASIPQTLPPPTPRPALGGQPIDELAAAAERQGIDIPRGAATDNLFARQIAGTVKEIPGVGAPLVRASQEALTSLGRRLDEVADEAAGGVQATRQSAGQAVKDDIAGWIKEGSKAEGNKIYEDVNIQMGDDAGGPLANLKAALQGIKDEAAASKIKPPRVVDELAEAAKAGELSYKGAHRLRQEIGDRLSGKVAPEPGMSERALNRIYGALSDDLRAMAGKEGENLLEEQMAGAVARVRADGEAALREKTKRPTKAAIAKAQDDAEAAFRETTEFVGMRDRANEGGLAIWDTANARFAKEIAEKREQLTKIVGVQGDAAPEAVVDRLITMAGSKQGGDLTRLIAAKQVVSAEAWGEFASTVIRSMGDTKNGFSPAVFGTAWHKLSDQGKNLLFSKEHRQALDDLATISQRFEQLQKLGNPSGTGRLGSVIAAVTGALTAPHVLIASVVGGNMAARWLAQPIRARQMADFADAYVKAAQSRTDRNLKAYERAAQALAAAAFEDRQKEGSGGPN